MTISMDFWRREHTKRQHGVQLSGTVLSKIASSRRCNKFSNDNIECKTRECAQSEAWCNFYFLLIQIAARPSVPLWCTAPPAAWRLLTHFAVSHLLRAHASRFYAARRSPLATRRRRFRFRYFTLCAPRCDLDTLHDVCNVALYVVCCLFCCQGICCRVHDAAAAARKLGETIDMWTLLCRCQF